MSEKHIAIYTRVSSKAQDHRSQLPDLQRWAESQDLPVKWYADKFTGRTMNRPGWNKIEAAYRAGKVSKIVCWRVDRLGRTARELLNLFAELRERRVDLVVVMSGMMGLDTPEGRMFLGFTAQFAEYDNEIRSERVRAGQAVARKAGKTWGGSKPGRKTAQSPTPEQVEAVRHLKAQGYSKTAIAKAQKLSRPTVIKILKS